MNGTPTPACRFSAPNTAESYRRIGPFDAANVPDGLLREHRLKPGTWARLKVLAGRLGFAWDDHADETGTIILAADQTIDVPPTVPHHLVPQDATFLIEIEFLSERAS